MYLSSQSIDTDIRILTDTNFVVFTGENLLLALPIERFTLYIWSLTRLEGSHMHFLPLIIALKRYTFGIKQRWGSHHNWIPRYHYCLILADSFLNKSLSFVGWAVRTIPSSSVWDEKVSIFREDHLKRRDWHQNGCKFVWRVRTITVKIWKYHESLRIHSLWVKHILMKSHFKSLPESKISFSTIEVQTNSYLTCSPVRFSLRLV